MQSFQKIFLNGFQVDAQSEYQTKFVASAYIGDIDQIKYDKLDVVEVIGYRNTRNRRMESKIEDGVEYTNILGETATKPGFRGIFPGDGVKTDPDYAMDSNKEFIIPPTGQEENNKLTTILILLTMTAISISYILGVKSDI